MTTTAITSTGTRQTQNLTVPSTQNTAPVLEFRCLYTHDLRRKQKRWQDGLLRFHTFNKRVMVYDVPRNYIGDTHYRDNGVLQDGDELELDRGVLIQVGEATGSMEQDLTELLEKKRKPQGTAPYEDVSSPVRECPAVATERPVMGQPSQLRPKSLNALLGRPKRQTGRASLPTKSPHEIRQENQIPGWADERPAKRQRLNTQSEQIVQKTAVPAIQTPIPSRLPDKSSIRKNMAVNSVASRQVIMPHPATPRDDGNGEPASETHSRLAQSRGRQSHGLETTEPRQKVTTSQQPRDGVTLYDANPIASQKSCEDGKPKRRVKGTVSQHQDFTSRMAEKISSRPLRDSSTPRRMKPAMEPIEINSDTETFSTCKSPKERMRLQIASRKPRRKLMYCDLLPQDPPAVSRPFCDRASTGQGSRESSVSTKSNRRPKNLVSELHQEEDRVADRLNRYHRQEDHRIVENNAFVEERVHPPGLFLSREDDPHLSRPWTKDTEQKIRKAASPGHHVGDIANHVRTSRSLDPREGTIPKTSSTIRDTALTLSELDEVLFSGTLHQVSKPRSPQKTLPPTSPHNLSPSPPPMPAIPPSEPPCQTLTPPKRLLPKDSITSSPGFQIQAHSTEPKSGTSTPALAQIPAAAPDPAPPSVPVSPRPSTNPPLKLPSPINHPFKPPKTRSSLKKSNSDTSSIRPPPALPPERSDVQQAVKEVVKDVGQQTGSAWSKEAWDLFGCGRDGVECTYEEFKRKEGLL